MNNDIKYYKPLLVAVRRRVWSLNNPDTPTGVKTYWEDYSKKRDQEVPYECDAIEFEFAHMPKAKWEWDGNRYCRQSDYIQSTIHGMEHMLCDGYIKSYNGYDERWHAYNNRNVNATGSSLEDCFTSQSALEDRLHLVVTVWPREQELGQYVGVLD